MPPSKYFEKHPEYYAYFNGQRTPQQLCFTNPGTIQIIRDNVDSLIKENPQFQYWGISANDVRVFCQGGNSPNDHCRKFIGHGGQSEIMMRLVNTVAADHPDKRFIYLAYGATLSLPITHPASNVTVMLAIYTGENRKDKDIASSPNILDIIKRWEAISYKMIYWDYYSNTSNSLIPFPDFYVIQPNFQFLRKNGIKMIFNEAEIDCNGEFAELRSYLLTELSWNPDLNVDEMIGDFLSKYYGRGSGYVKQYLQLITRNSHNLLGGGGRLYLGYPATFYNRGFLSLTNINRYLTLINQAENAVDKGSVFYARIRKLKFCLLYVNIELLKRNFMGSTSSINRDNHRNYNIKPETKKIIDEFIKIAESDSTVIDKNSPVLKEYIKNLNTLIATDIK